MQHKHAHTLDKQTFHAYENESTYTQTNAHAYKKKTYAYKKRKNARAYETQRTWRIIRNKKHAYVNETQTTCTHNKTQRKKNITAYENDTPMYMTNTHTCMRKKRTC